MKVQNNIVLNSDLTIRYNEDTDIIQCKIGSEWLDWLVAGMRILRAWAAGVTSGFTATTGGGGGAGGEKPSFQHLIIIMVS